MKENNLNPIGTLFMYYNVDENTQYDAYYNNYGEWHYYHNSRAKLKNINVHVGEHVDLHFHSAETHMRNVVSICAKIKIST